MSHYQLTPEQYEEVLDDIHAIAANPGPDQALAFSVIMRLARIEEVKKRLRVSPARVAITLLLSYAGGVLAWERTHDRLLTPVFGFLVAICVALELRPWRYR